MEKKESTDPLEINKSPEIIKGAQADIGKLDVLVCGECHDVFHYIEQFQEHRSNEKCVGISMVRENYGHEPKPQVWAFMLWKNAQFKKAKETDNVHSSWSIYQRWCKLAPEEKQTWVLAGQSIQTFTRISSAKVQEVRTKPPVPIKSKLIKSVIQPTYKNNTDSEHLEEGELRASQLSHTQRITIKPQVATNKVHPVDDDLFENDSEQEVEDNMDKSEEKTKKVVEQIKKPIIKNLQIIGDPTAIAKQKLLNAKKGLRTGKTEIEEAVVEKILNKRYNQKKKYAEYLVKWENFSESENTWEPKVHLSRCKLLLDNFEKLQLEKTIIEQNSMGRPQRTSKQKALTQVKEWCGDITDGDELSGKRKSFSDDDSSDSFEKKIKLEEDSDSSEDEKPLFTTKRTLKSQNATNGIIKKTTEGGLSTVQHVVSINPKQVPNLTTGVYIMSKTDGIIKLDPNTHSPAGPLLKVGSKIGQTHIKVVPKDAGSTSNTSKMQIKSPSISKIQKTSDLRPKPVVTRIMPVQRRTYSNTASKAHVKPPAEPIIIEPFDASPSKNEEDSDDGVEELEFPTDLPLPEPDSPPGEFILCPLTGKIVGQEYDETPTVAAAADTEETITENTSLDTLVKMAAAELPDVDMDTAPAIPVLKVEQAENIAECLTPVPPVEPEPEPDADIMKTEMIATTMTDLEAAIKPNAIEKSTSMVVNPTETTTAVPKPKTNVTSTSLLSNALTQSRPLSNSSKLLTTPKKLLSSPSAVRQKVTSINRPSTVKSLQTTTIIHKISSNRHKPQQPKSSIESSVPVLKRTSNVNTYKPANVARKIGNTTIYKTEKPAATTAVAATATAATVTAATATATIVPIAPKIETVSSPIPQISLPTTVVQTPANTPVINMPLLTTEEDTSIMEDSGTADIAEIEPLPVLSTENNEVADLSTFSLTDSETPIFVTGDDGTVYQVAGRNEDGQTILISEGADGQQQCIIVSSESLVEESPMLVADNTTESEQVDESAVVTALPDAEGDGEVVAQIVRANPPSPGGSRKVVLLLPDGNFMITQVTAEQYASIEAER